MQPVGLHVVTACVQKISGAEIHGATKILKKRTLASSS